MFNFIKDTLGLIEDIITLPTDIIGLTNFSSKKQARQYVDMLLMTEQITEKEHKLLMIYIDNEKTLNL